MKKCFCNFVGMIVAAALLPVAAAAVTTKQAGGWDDPATWEGDQVPGAGASVTVAHDVSLTNQTALIEDCTVNAGKSVTFVSTNAILRAMDVTINGTLTHANNTATSTNALGQWVPNGRVYVICSNLFVATTGHINADTRGYGGLASGTGSGYGPGGGGPQGGGGYGGRGGTKSNGTGAGGTYGSADWPDQPGSGGGNENGDPAGAGGGLIRIEAQGTVTVNGRISANGAYLTQPTASGNGRGAGGSGGGIAIACRTFAGTDGTVSAIGGWARPWFPGGGGGGRIAVAVDPVAQASAPPVSVRFQCAGGLGQSGGGNGAHGTVHVSDSRILPTLWNGREASVRISGFTEWSPSHLIVSNAQILIDEQVNVVIAGDLSLVGTTDETTLRFADAATVYCVGHMTASSATLHLFRREASLDIPTLRVDGDLSLSTQSGLHVYAGLTNTPSTHPYSARVEVGGTMRLTGGSVVHPYCHETNGGFVAFSIRHLSVAAGCGFDADGKGYWGAPANTSANGYGPGAGKFLSGAIGGGGGGHGGAGGAGWSNPSGGGGTYGASNAPPVFAGSGGGNRNDGTLRAGDGGGVIHIETDGTVTLDGYLKSNGALMRSGGERGGGGSGGAIYLKCRTIQGSTGSLSANGGPGRRWGGGGGGGGRIQVWSVTDLTGGLVTTSAQKGLAVAGENGSNGFEGTVHWGTIPASGTGILIR